MDEVHTVIYKELHPVKTFGKTLGKGVLGVVPKIVSLANDKIGSIIPNLEYILKSKKETKKQKKRNKKTTGRKQIIILDDFERTDFKKISFNEILGYFNDLLMQQVKIIVVSNTKEIKEEGFIDFKEKVFDREYRISTTKIEIIRNYFGKNENLLDDTIIAEFSDNLRVANRVSEFFKEVTKNLSQYNKEYSSIYSKKFILWLCTLVVVGANTGKYEKFRIEKDKENKETDYPAVFRTKIKISDSQINELVEDIIFYTNNSETNNFRVGEDFILSLVKFYYYDDISRFLPFFAGESETERNPLLQQIFYLSDEKKKEMLNEQFEYLLSGKDIGTARLYGTVKNFCDYGELFDFCKKEELLINFLLQNKDRFQEEIYCLDALSSSGNETYDKNSLFVEFVNKLEKRFQDSLLKEFIEEIKDNIKNKNYGELYDKLCEIKNKTVCQFIGEDKKRYLKQELLELLRENSYLLDNLEGSITHNQWGVALSVVKLSSRFGFSEEIRPFIEKYNINDNCSAKERYDELIRQLK